MAKDMLGNKVSDEQLLDRGQALGVSLSDEPFKIWAAGSTFPVTHGLMNRPM